MDLRILSCVGATIAATALSAQAAVFFTGSSISDNLDGLPTTSTTISGTGAIGAQGAVPGTIFDAARIAGSGTGAVALTVDTGAANSGAAYSYGNASSSTERALGLLASGTTTVGTGVVITNGTAGDVITSISINLIQENWRSSTTNLNTVAASFGTTDTGVSASSYLTATTGFSPVATLDLVGPLPASTNGALNGNDPVNQAARTATITGLNLAPGESFFLRFQDFNDTGNDAGLAIDNFSASFTTSPVPEPTTFAALGGLSALVLRRRR
jgi:hypothetical protein